MKTIVLQRNQKNIFPSFKNNSSKGASINYVGRRGGGVLAKCLCYYISLCNKLAYEGGGGQKLVKSCLRSLWMVPNKTESRFSPIIVKKKYPKN